jgi:hypothetical protein
VRHVKNGHHYVFAQRGSAPRPGFVDQFEDQNNLASVIADATRDVLVEYNGRLSIVREGKCVHASIEGLQALIAERVEVQKLVSRDGIDELVYSPCVLSHAQVRALLTADNLKSGSLPARVWKA